MAVKMNKCIIVGAGEFDIDNWSCEKDDYVIAADAGWMILEQLGIVPDLLIGDMDSLDENGVEQMCIRDRDSFAARVSDKCETIKSCANSTIKVLNRMYGTQTAYNRYGTNGYYYGSSGSRYNAKS